MGLWFVDLFSSQQGMYYLECSVPTSTRVLVIVSGETQTGLSSTSMPHSQYTEMGTQPVHPDFQPSACLTNVALVGRLRRPEKSLAPGSLPSCASHLWTPEAP